jgi:hypothetical protein
VCSGVPHPQGDLDGGAIKLAYEEVSVKDVLSLMEYQVLKPPSDVLKRCAWIYEANLFIWSQLLTMCNVQFLLS